jgi:hypothetical protein
MKTVTWHCALWAICFVTGAQPLWADSASGKTVPAEQRPGADRFVAGCPVSVALPVAGDLIAAGCNVEVLAEVDGDVVVMGGNVRLAAPVKQGVYAAGGRVSIEAPVQRNVRIAGGRVELGPNAKVAGNVTVGGGRVEIDGVVGGYVQVGAGSVRINGSVAGDVELGAGDVELGPNARIEGKLRYASGEDIRRDSAAQVRGGVERIERGGRWPAEHRWRDGTKHRHAWLWSVGLLAIAAILVAAFPQFCKRIAETTRARWALSLLIGFIVLVCVPVAALIAIISLIGIPLALVTIALYLMLLLVGYVSAGIALGDIALQRWRAERAAKPGWRIAAAVLAMLVLSLLGRVPFVGWLVTLAAMLIGIGALLMQTRPAPATSAMPSA